MRKAARAIVAVVAVVAAVILVGMVAFQWVGMPLPWRYEGQWVVTTTIPQICWTPGQQNSVQETGWHKMSDEDVWYRVVGKPVEYVSIDDLRVHGDVCYPGETPEQCRMRREELD